MGVRGWAELHRVVLVLAAIVALAVVLVCIGSIRGSPTANDVPARRRRIALWSPWRSLLLPIAGLAFVGSVTLAVLGHGQQHALMTKLAKQMAGYLPAGAHRTATEDSEDLVEWTYAMDGDQAKLWPTIKRSLAQHGGAPVCYSSLVNGRRVGGCDDTNFDLPSVHNPYGDASLQRSVRLRTLSTDHTTVVVQVLFED